MDQKPERASAPSDRIDGAQATTNDGSKAPSLPTDSAPQNASAGKDVGAENESIPLRIGRYRIERLVGRGGFGCVYQGWDESLRRPVAIKVPLRHRVLRPEDMELYLAEAQTLARLQHPHIVPVYDFGRTEDDRCYVVSRFIEGSDLAKRIRERRPDYLEAASLVARIADALSYAHRNGIVHRDIKPANTLLDQAGNPWLADFGLALREEDFGHGSGIAGTPSYMSPEQARGEGHRVDGRSDIFSLGVVFYELLTGRCPFRGSSLEEVLDQIRHVEVWPPRQLNELLPRELERICLKALSKRAADRYLNAADLAEDLRSFSEGDRAASPVSMRVPAAAVSLGTATVTALAVPASPPLATARIVPKGLRAFDAADSDFFLDLLPGPRDRDGLPESLRFWKSRIEARSSEVAFPVGVLYGPSGCGKSSLVRAGLLPRLGARIVAIAIEATPEETETRLRKALNRAFPELRPEMSLAQMMTSLRRAASSQHRKVLIVLDQFEQWLHAHREQTQGDLVEALRQCDGERLQCLVLVRDDFWMAVTRFMRDLEVRLVEGENSAAVDLFEVRHARRVLQAYGHAFGQLPEREAALTSDQKAFLEKAVSGLAQNGRVICVRLALFADMVRLRPWTLATFKEIGGAQGVGVTYLEETFSARTAPPAHRAHERAAHRILRALLPATGADIKGHMRSRGELIEASGLTGRPDEFAEVLRILDRETRLVTPTDPEGEDEPQRGSAASRHYQLTHDYLVPSLREWLIRKDRETRRGRAEQRLTERESNWSHRHESRHLPSVAEDLSIRLLTRRSVWSSSQRAMMRSSAWFHGVRIGAILCAFCLLFLAGRWFVNEQVERDGRRADLLVELMLSAPPHAVSLAIDNLKSVEATAIPIMKQRLGDEAAPMSSRARAAMALAAFGERSALGMLLDWTGSLPSVEFHNVVAACRAADDRAALYLIRDRFLSEVSQVEASSRARLAILALHLGDAQLAHDMCRPSANPEQRNMFCETLETWNDGLTQLAKHAEVASGSLQSTVCVSIGRMQPADLSESDRDAGQRFLAALYSHATDPGTHGAADWALRQWAVDLPPLASAPLVARSTADEPALRNAALRSPLKRNFMNQSPMAIGPQSEPQEDVMRRLAREVGSFLEAQGQQGVSVPQFDGPPGSSGSFLRQKFLEELKALDINRVNVGYKVHGSFTGEPDGRTIITLTLKDRDNRSLKVFSAIDNSVENLISVFGRDVEFLPAFHASVTTVARAAFVLNPQGAGGVELAPTIDEVGKAQDAPDSAPRPDLRVSHPGDIPPPEIPGISKGWYRNSVGMTMMRIPADSFRMGSTRLANHRPVDVVLTHPFYLADREVTRAAFRRFIEDDKTPPSGKPDRGLQAPWSEAEARRRQQVGSGGDSGGLTDAHPQDSVNWDDALLFCNWLSRQEGRVPCYEENAGGIVWRRDADGYRLPSQAEWECACRAAAATDYSFGDDSTLLATYATFGETLPMPVATAPSGSRRPNAWGLFDMHGNVAEWCWDSYTTVLPGGVDPEVSTEPELRVARGGSWRSEPTECQSAYRQAFRPWGGDSTVGFRVATNRATDE